MTSNASQPTNLLGANVALASLYGTGAFVWYTLTSASLHTHMQQAPSADISDLVVGMTGLAISKISLNASLHVLGRDFSNSQLKHRMLEVMDSMFVRGWQYMMEEPRSRNPAKYQED